MTLAIKEAEKSEMMQRHGCVIVRGSSVLGKSSNKRRGHDFYGWLPADACSFHAEVAAIRMTKRDLSNATIYIARINGSGQPRLSAPCSNCQKAIENAGIKKVVYTVDE